jgi:vancomycin resistance protein YoaR
MRRISRWTTYFPVSEKNGNGANIWIPARLIDGYVVGPGETFDFWDAVGPVTREKGYKDGGAIINGRTEPQGALAGGICSCSTTLFNAALRAGYEMGDRRNHYYYIDRYPLGLDATVFISGSGSVQTMSFTNDTRYPILIRGRGWREGGSGYVRFDLYSVPTGRKVSFTKPVVKNVRRATDTVEYTSALPAGTSKRIEYPVDGKQVWVTRIVRDRDGSVIHKDTYYSNYARITGVTLVGR